MNIVLTIAIVVLAALVVASLVRGIIAFLHTTKLDLEGGDDAHIAAMQQRQNRMMFKRIQYQGLAVVVVALLLLLNR